MKPNEPEPTQQQVVHVARPLEPAKPVISDELRARHEASQREYPFLNLSEGEFVINAVRRHPIGLVLPIGLGSLLLVVLLTIAVSYEEFAFAAGLVGPLAEPGLMSVILLASAALVGLGMFVSYYVYVHNKFFLTNESVIQEIQHSLFSRLEQTVSLGNIEDASFTRHRILQHIFDYGSIRLSTEGDETTYRFSYVAHPKEHIAELNNAVEAFKNGRPVGTDN